MPAQPLSSMRKNAEIVLGGSVARLRPRHAALGAEAIALAADIDALLGGILTTMLGAQAKPAAAMYYSLSSDFARVTALRAAADSVYGPDSDELMVFNAIMVVSKRLSKARNYLAHWCWGVSDEIPDGLLLIDPRALIEHDMTSKLQQSPHNGRMISGNIDRSRIFVYKEGDLIEIVEALYSVADAISHFRFSLNTNFSEERRQTILNRLKKYRIIALEIENALAKRAKNTQ